jgi:hypothetical protein
MFAAAVLRTISLATFVSVLPALAVAESFAPLPPTIRPEARVVRVATPAILEAINPELRPVVRNPYLPRTRWNTIPGGRL